jgi:hypothetical protein
VAYFIGAATITFGVLLIMGFALYHRNEPDWIGDSRRLGILLLGQIALIILLLVAGFTSPD